MESSQRVVGRTEGGAADLPSEPNLWLHTLCHPEDENGNPLVVRCEPQIAACLAAGTGYVANPEWVHGQYHGPLKLEAVEVDVATAEQRGALGPLYEHICRFELNTGEVGYGMFENISVGHHFKYGFDSFEAVAG